MHVWQLAAAAFDPWSHGPPLNVTKGHCIGLVVNEF